MVSTVGGNLRKLSTGAQLQTFVVAGFPNLFPDTPISLLIPLCVLFGHLHVRLYSCVPVCVCAALLVTCRAAPTVLHLCRYFVPSLSAQVRKTTNDCYFAGRHAQLVKLTGNTVETRAFSASYTSVVTPNGYPNV